MVYDVLSVPLYSCISILINLVLVIALTYFQALIVGISCQSWLVMLGFQLTYQAVTVVAQRRPRFYKTSVSLLLHKEQKRLGIV